MDVHAIVDKYRSEAWDEMCDLKKKYLDSLKMKLQIVANKENVTFKLMHDVILVWNGDTSETNRDQNINGLSQGLLNAYINTFNADVGMCDIKPEKK